MPKVHGLVAAVAAMPWWTMLIVGGCVVLCAIVCVCGVVAFGASKQAERKAMKFFEVGEGGGLALAEQSGGKSPGRVKVGDSGRVKVGDSARPVAGSSGSLVSVAAEGTGRGRTAEHKQERGGLLFAAL